MCSWSPNVQISIFLWIVTGFSSIDHPPDAQPAVWQTTLPYSREQAPESSLRKHGKARVQTLPPPCGKQVTGFFPFRFDSPGRGHAGKPGWRGWFHRVEGPVLGRKKC